MFPKSIPTSPAVPMQLCFLGPVPLSHSQGWLFLSFLGSSLEKGSCLQLLASVTTWEQNG